MLTLADALVRLKQVIDYIEKEKACRWGCFATAEMSNYYFVEESGGVERTELVSVVMVSRL